MKKALSILAFGLLLGYGLGVMFNGFNTIVWPTDAKAFYVLWFAILCGVCGAVWMFDEGNAKS